MESGNALSSHSPAVHVTITLPREENDLLSNGQRFGLIPQAPKAGFERIVFCNIDGLPQARSYNPKVKIIRDFLQQLNVDLFCGCEHNLNIKALGGEHILRNWFRSSNPTRLVTAFNEFYNTGVHQFGGSMMLAMGEMCDSVRQQGADETGMGRWTWTYLRGKQTGTRVISAYRPNRSEPGKLRTVYNQQKIYLESKGDNTCPRRAFFRDLAVQIQQWQEEGDKIILMADFNEDIRSNQIRQQMSALNLFEAVLSRYPHLPAPVSFSRGTRNGTSPIDGVWISPDLYVQTAAYLTVAESPGDHRAIVLDISLASLCGQSLQRIVRPPSRRLQSSNLQASLKYCRLLSDYCQRNQLLFRAQSLRELPVTDPFFKQEIEAIDKSLTEGMITSEAACRKLRMGVIPFSPDFARAKRLRFLWGQLVLSLSGQPVRIGNHAMRRLARKLDVSLLHSLEEAQSLLVQSHKAYAKIKPCAASLRSEFLLAKMQDPDLSPTAMQEYSQLLAREEARDHASLMRRIKGKARSKAIAEIEIPVGNDWELVSEQASVEQHISQHMTNVFCLADDSPSRREPFRSGLHLGETEWAKEILDGTFVCPPGTDEVTQQFLAGMRRSPTFKEGTHSIEPNDYIQFWKRAKESTSSSRSGRHFGHYKAALNSPHLIDIHVTITSLAFSKGYSLHRWQQGIQAILEKKEGLIRINKLRAILLMEADFNFANKLFVGFRMMKHLARAGSIPSEVYGGVKNKDARAVGLLRRLIPDVSRQMRLPLAIASVDAQSCYDRIAHPIASLACQRLGVPGPVMSAMFSTVQMMRFFLRTAYGDSDSFYGGGPQPDGRIPQGVCQGNGAGPAVWIAISLCLLEFLRQFCSPFNLLSCISHHPLELFGTVYVDDTDLMSISVPSEYGSDSTVNRLRQSVTAWSQGLRETGGTLMPSKCSWSLLDFTWVGNRCKIRTTAPTQPPIMVLDSQGVQAPLSFVPPTASVEVVGFHQSLDGSMSAQLQVITDKVLEWANNVRDNYIDQSALLKGLRNTIWPSLRFPLLATTFTRAQGDELMKPLMRAILPKLVVNRNYPLVMRYAPRCYGGLQMPHLYYEQGIEQIETVLKYGNDLTTNEGIALLQSLEALQLEIGTGTPILLADYRRFGYLATPCWVTSVWEFCHTSDIQLEGGPSPPPLRRIHDAYLMDLFTSPGHRFDKASVRAANRCRRFLRVITLADVFTGDGERLVYSFQSAERRTPLDSRYTWPKERPTRSDFATFYRLLHQVVAASPLRLMDWTQPSHIGQRWWYSVNDNVLYHHSCMGLWKRYHQHPTDPLRYEIQATNHPQAQPTLVQRASVWELGEGQVEFEGSMQEDGTYRYAAKHLGDLIASDPAWWPLRQASMTDNGANIAQAITTRTAQAVSDGSYNPTKNSSLGSAAWVIEDNLLAGVNMASGLVHTTGGPREVNAYRSELQGIHAIFVALTAICQLHKVTQGSVLVCCDGLSALMRSSSLTTVTRQTVKHADLIRAIRRLCHALPCRVSFRHIKGHQDDARSYAILPRLAQLNVLCDYLAKKYLDRLTVANEVPLQHAPLLGEGFRCMINDQKVTSDVRAPVLQQVFKGPVSVRLHEKQQVLPTSFNNIAWEAIDTSQETTGFQIWASKFSNGHLGVGHMMRRWQFWDHAECPCCHHNDETTQHVITCPDPRMRQCFSGALSSLRAFLSDIDTLPSSIDWICSYAMDQQYPASTDPTLLAATSTQRSIGHHNLFLGRLATHWRPLQESHYKEIGSRRSSFSWERQVSMKLLSVARDMWFQRNEVLHAKDEAGRKLSEVLELNQEIDRQFELGDEQIRPIDRHLLHRPAQEIKNLSLPDRRAWLIQLQFSREMFQDS